MPSDLPGSIGPSTRPAAETITAVPPNDAIATGFASVTTTFRPRGQVRLTEIDSTHGNRCAAARISPVAGTMIVPSPAALCSAVTSWALSSRS